MNIIVTTLSICCLVVSTVLAIFSQRIFKKFKSVKPIYILLTGAFLATLVMMLYVDFKPEVHGKAATLFLAVFHSIQVMLLGYDFEFLYEAFSITEEYASFSYAYLSVLFFLTPAYTFGFVLSFFESVNSYLRYLMKRKKDIYLLSDVSEKSVMLASSIRKKDAKALIAFVCASEISADMKDKIKEIKAISFKKDIADIGLRFHSKASKAVFFTMSENEAVNLEASLAIIDSFSQRRNTELYVFSTSKEGELLLDSADDGFMKVRRINEDRSFAYSIISDYPITDNCTFSEDGKKIISTLIIGFGGYGSELTKALLWCGQLPGYELEINVMDKDKLAESKFKAECPEIFELNGNNEIGEAIYKLTFYNEVDVLSYRASEIISSLKNTSVVYVSLGDDELNIEVAINARILFERIGLYPVIKAIVYSDIKYKTLKERNLINHQGEKYDIEIIGNIEKRFDYDTIINEDLEALALKCHLCWANSPEEKETAIKQFNEYEYYRSSSIATAIHEKYREREELSEEEAVIAEHMRWNAYMRTEGFIYSGSREETSRNDRAKMHNNLHRFGLLDDKDIDKDRRIIKNKHGKNILV